MRILFVSMAASIHTARWIEQIADQSWDIHLFPSFDSPVHPSLKGLTIHDAIVCGPSTQEGASQMPDAWHWPFASSADLANRVFMRLRRSRLLGRWITPRSERLAQVIQKIQPDIIHSQEIQHGGYLTLEARERVNGSFPRWIVTNWGSDIYLFGNSPDHAPRIRAVLEACDYYSCECQRDVELARAFGFSGEVLPVLPIAGGLDLQRLNQIRDNVELSSRRHLIMLKGYQSWAGRALVGLKALELCMDLLRDYTIAIYLASPEVKRAAERLQKATKIPVHIVPPSPHRQILDLHGQARISIGLSISDALSTSFLEAIAMGSFPIQSDTSCAGEWIENGKSGFLVPPEDASAVAAALRRALTDDVLVDGAAEQNANIVADRLDRSVIQPQVLSFYERIANDAATRRQNQ